MGNSGRKKLVDQLDKLVLLLSSRGVGHTRLMFDGISNYKGKYVIVGNTLSDARRQLEISGVDVNNAKIYSIGSRIPITQLPVAIDNSVLHLILHSALQHLKNSISEKEANDLIAERVAVIEKNQEKKISMVASTLNNDILNDVMKIAEIYQDRSHLIESLTIDYLSCNWWEFTKKSNLKNRIIKESADAYTSDRLDSIFAKYKK
jgi:hypothetical protein